MTAQKLVEHVRGLRRSGVREIVDKRMAEFEEFAGKSNDEWFSELCFCILTANSTARLGMKIQRELGDDGFLMLPPDELAARLKTAGHRFPNTRARFIVEARRFRDTRDIIARFTDARQARAWLVKNVKGIGWKEASHFLRNVGFDNVAILDRHVLSVMREHGLIDEAPRTLTRRRYLEIEEKLEWLAQKLGLSLGELDLYLWYTKTGEVLK